MTEYANITPSRTVEIDLTYPDILKSVRDDFSLKAPITIAEELSLAIEGTSFTSRRDNLSMDDVAPPFMAFCTYMTSKFWVDNIKNRRSTAQRIDIKILEKTIKIYSVSGVTIKSLPTDGYLADGAIHASILGLNSAVDSFYKHNNKFAFTPLGRVAISDNQIGELAEVMNEFAPMDTRTASAGKTAAVRAVNVCTARKSWQMANSSADYIPELAIACLLRSMASENVKPATKEIGQKQIKKIVNAAGSNINITQIISMMRCLTGVGATGIETEQIIQEWKSAGYRTRWIKPIYPEFDPEGRTYKAYKTAREAAPGEVSGQPRQAEPEGSGQDIRLEETQLMRPKKQGKQ